MAAKKKSKAPTKSIKNSKSSSRSTRLKSTELMRINEAHRKTSIGLSTNSKPTNKHKRRSWKRYRGQGK